MDIKDNSLKDALRQIDNNSSSRKPYTAPSLSSLSPIDPQGKPLGPMEDFANYGPTS